jgi:tetratricopeptide (TPR) repeat protein
MAIWSAEIKELERLYESFKGQLPEMEKELGQLIHFDDPNVILLYSRRSLEVIITDLCERELKRERGSEPLKGIIDKLNKEKKIPAHIASSMYGLNELSTYGTHPKGFDPEQVKPVLNNLDIIIKWYLKYKDIKIKVKTEEKIQIREERSMEVKKEVRNERYEKPVSLKKNKLLSGILITAILVIAAIFAYRKIFKRDTLDNLRSSGERISVAVMPFQNMTNDTVWNVWQDGIQDNLSNALSNSEELKVRQTESVTTLIRSKGLSNYVSITPAIARTISRNLDADIFVDGSIKLSGNTLRINTQIVDSRSSDIIRSYQVDGLPSNILSIVDSISRIIRDFLIISKMEKTQPIDYDPISLSISPEAYRFYLYGQQAFYQEGNYSVAVKMYSQALAIDSTFVNAAIMLPFAYRNQGLYDEAKAMCLKIYGKRDQMTLVQKLWVDWLYSLYFETTRETINYTTQILDLDDQSPAWHAILGIGYNTLHQYDKAIPEGEKALEIYRKWDVKPSTVWVYTNLGYAYHIEGMYKKEERLYKKAESEFPDNKELIARQAILFLSLGDTTKVDHLIEKLVKLDRDSFLPEADINANLADIYFVAGIPSIAERYYNKALSLDPVNFLIMNRYAFFLIDSNQNLNKGLDLINKALTLNPDNYLFLETKGWGLYKQGKYQEALDILQQSWDLRREKAVYNHEAYLHLEAAKKAVSNQKNF